MLLPAFGATVVNFRIRGALPVGAHTLSVIAESNGQTFTTGYQLIDYDHIRPQTMYRDATVTLEAVDVRIPPGANVAYIQGVGDNSAPALQQLGIPVTILDPSTLATADLAPYTAIVIGTRAYEAHPELVANNARLLDWVKKGGTMVVQYGQYEMTQPGIMPYPITLTRPAARVTEENSAVTVLDPKNPLLIAPNAIGAGDWTGWVQDRALYMPSTFDSAYAAPLAMHDTGEPDNRGALLVANYGRGTYVYVTLAFFRQLPGRRPRCGADLREPPRRPAGGRAADDAVVRLRGFAIAAARRARRVRRRRQAHGAHRLQSAREGPAHLLRAGLRGGASRHRCPVGGHGVAGHPRPRAQRGREPAGGRLVRRAGGDLRARGGGDAARGVPARPGPAPSTRPLATRTTSGTARTGRPRSSRTTRTR